MTQHPDVIYKALVVDELRSKYRIVLIEFLLMAEIKRQNGTILIPGQEIRVKAKRADPWDDILELEYVNE
jgi:exoribonuclease-2